MNHRISEYTHKGKVQSISFEGDDGLGVIFLPEVINTDVSFQLMFGRPDFYINPIPTQHTDTFDESRLFKTEDI